MWLLLAIAVGLAAVPAIGDRYTVVLMTDVLVFALFAASLGLLMGFGGLASFGHAAYFGAGAYAAAIAAKAGVPFPLALVCGSVMAGLLAAFFGWFAVRASGISFAMLTLAFAQITWAVVFQWDAVTGGSNGIIGVWPPALIASKTLYYLITLVLVGAALLFVWRMAYTPFGHLLRAVRDSSARAEAVGIEPRRVQLVAFVVSGAVAGLAGTVFAFSKGSLSPDILAIPRSMDGLVMVLLGGLETLAGPAVGAAVLTLLQDWITRMTSYWQGLLGLSVIILTLAFPDGIVGTLSRRSNARGNAP